MAGDILSQGQDALNAIGAALTYTIGNCTRWVAENLNWIPGGLGNANQWFANAKARGLPTGQTPVPGSVAVFGIGQFGHVGIVQSVLPGGGFVISEENWLGNGITDLRNVTGSGLNGLLGFIYPPNFDPSKLPVVGGIESTVTAPLTTAEAVAGLPASIGHGLANATSATSTNVGTFFKNNIVALVVALTVALVLFAPGDQH